jgi:hypothetical protein
MLDGRAVEVGGRQCVALVVDVAEAVPAVRLAVPVAVIQARVRAAGRPVTLDRSGTGFHPASGRQNRRFGSPGGCGFGARIGGISG